MEFPLTLPWDYDSVCVNGFVVGFTVSGFGQPRPHSRTEAP